MAVTTRATLSAGPIRAEVSTHGAELESLRRVDADIEYLWQGDPTVWNRRAPILFPVVGRLRDDRYVVADREYSLPQHGFARDCVFSVTQRGDASLTLVLQQTAETLRAYPFPFRLEVSYLVRDGSLAQRVCVHNPGDRPLPFSVGLHPGFRCPLLPGETLEDYAVRFEVPETADRYPVVDGLVARGGVPCLHGQRSLPLRSGMFDGGALVFRELRSRRLRLVGRSGRGVELAYPGFPYLGIWAKPVGGFVCLEPWCGIADPPDASGRIEDKEGIVWLPPGETFGREARISPF